MEKIRELKKALRTNGQGGTLNGKPLSFLLGKWSETYEYTEGITVKFVPVTYKFPANVAMYVNIDAACLETDFGKIEKYTAFFEDYLLRYYSNVIGELSEKYTMNNKLERLLSKIQCQKPDCRIIRRSGLLYRKEEHTFVLKLFVLFPTGAGVSILGERMSRMITDILGTIEESNALIDKKGMYEKLETYKKQLALREFCRKSGFVAFVADGSILPRKSDSEEPLKTAVPFKSPETMRVKVAMEDGTELSGMGIPRGITVITGAGFSGKTTLLEAIESGIYHHVPGDGREFIVSEQTLMVTNAEDGRYVANEDISMFFSDIPFQSITDFTTRHASGSISQAANITEAIIGGSRLLTIDEDKSATNFMIRDELMRKIVKDEVIIPFTDRIRTIAEKKGVSSILVIGGSGEYLKIADTVILMNQYAAADVTREVKEMELPAATAECPEFTEQERNVLVPGEGIKALSLRTVCTEDSKKVICGDYSVDMTAVPSIKSNEQLQSLARIMRSMLSKGEGKAENICALSEIYAGQLFTELENEQAMSDLAYRGWWFDEIRKEEIIMCINRMRGICFEGG